MSGWLPIETAPRDGRLVDLWCVGEEDDIRFYCRDAFGKRAGRVAECYFTDGAWRPYMGLTRGMSLPLDPTHWMPLPSPPDKSAP